MANSPADGVVFSNISATTAAFPLAGGVYGMDAVATFGGGSVTLQRLAGDGTTWLTYRPVAGYPLPGRGIQASDALT